MAGSHAVTKSRPGSMPSRSYSCSRVGEAVYGWTDVSARQRPANVRSRASSRAAIPQPRAQKQHTKYGMTTHCRIGTDARSQGRERGGSSGACDFIPHVTLATTAPCPRLPVRRRCCHPSTGPAAPSRCGGRSATARSATERCPAWRVLRPSMASPGPSPRRRRRQIRPWPYRRLRPATLAGRSYSRRRGCSLAIRSASD